MKRSVSAGKRSAAGPEGFDSKKINTRPWPFKSHPSKMMTTLTSCLHAVLQLHQLALKTISHAMPLPPTLCQTIIAALEPFPPVSIVNQDFTRNFRNSPQISPQTPSPYRG